MVVKNKSFVPGSGKYKDEMAQFSKLARGSSIPRFKQGRWVDGVIESGLACL